MNEPRPIQHLKNYTSRYPSAWTLAESLRARRHEIGDWPTWCYLPLAGAYAIVSNGRPGSAGLGHDVGIVGALAAWPMTRGVYRFDPTLLEAVRSTPLDGELPEELLERLPEWCIYVETPAQPFADRTLHGFFAHLEYDPQHQRKELRLVLDLDQLIPVPIHLTGGSLTESVNQVMVEAQQEGANLNKEILQKGPKFIAKELAPLFSTLLYLCSVTAEVRDARGTDRQPANPQPTRTRSGLKLFPAVAPTTWEVSYRLGAALRAAQARESGVIEGEHTSLRPHVRRAHWHTFLTGAGRRKRILKWLPPIAVNLEDAGDLPATIRKVD